MAGWTHMTPALVRMPMTGVLARAAVALGLVASFAHPGPPAQPSREVLDRAAALELVEVTLRQRIGGPSVMDVTLTGERDREPLFDDAEAALVRAHAELLAPRALQSLEASGDPISGLVLAFLDDARAVRPLRRWFVDARDMYGWETSRPCPLDDGQHPARMAYDEALRKLTGRGASAIALSDQQRTTLNERARGLESDDALYVLARLAPADAFAVLAPQFRATRDRHTRFELALMLEHVVPLRLDAAEVRRTLGPPDRASAAVLTYALTNMHEEPEELRVELERGRVAHVTISARDQ